MRYLTKVAIAALLLGISATLVAETRYVSDQLRITVRSGKSTGHAVITTLDSGDAVEVLQTDSDSGYSEVRLPNGRQGWALSRYLRAQPIARDQLKNAQTTLAKVQQELAEIRPASQQQAAQIDALTEERDQLATVLEELRIQTADSMALIEKDQRQQ
ncbi:MAG: TIGR04211 family SH3 domain-containing protein, partial [Gammaproteobacteria bacterium]